MCSSDLIQLVKGWIDGDGRKHERVMDIARSNADGAGVNLDNCEPTGAGARSLCGYWRDADFDPQQDAFYYARVLENPSCRWSTHICNAQRVDCSKPDALSDEQAECCRPELKKTVQERAWTSPIWYSAN